jgi:hypothetical protein
MYVIPMILGIHGINRLFFTMDADCNIRAVETGCVYSLDKRQSLQD